MKYTISESSGSRIFKGLSRFMMALALSLYVFSTISCTNIFESPLEEDTSTEYEEENVTKVPELKEQNKGGVTITLESNIQRTILPDIDPSNLTSITLSGTKAGQNYSQTLATWNSISELSGQTVALDLGVWNLVLTANNNSFIFSDSKNVEITLGQSQNVAFVLNTSETGGGIDFKISFSNNAQKIEYTLYKYNGTSFTPIETNNDTPINTESSGRSFTYQRNSSNPVDVGIYRLALKFYADAEKSILLNTYSEIINVIAGFVSRSVNKTINLNQMYTIVYHNDLTGCSVFDSDGNATTLPEKYSLHTGEITLPQLSKTGFIFEGWYTQDASGVLSSSPVTAITASEAGNKEFWAVFNIELKEGPAFKSAISAWSTAERMAPSSTPPDSSVTITQYLDTGTSVPVWYDSTENCIRFFAEGHTNGTKKLLLRPNSNNLFMNMSGLRILDLTVFDSSRVTDMAQMFFNDSNLEKVYVTSAFTTNSVTTSTNMFYGCSTKLSGENAFTWSSSNAADKTYAKINTATEDGYFWNAEGTPVYLIIYNCGTNPNGVNAAANPVAYITSELPITLSAPTRSTVLAGSLAGNYQFEGWFNNASCSGSPVSTIPVTQTGNVTLYAKWKVPYLVEHVNQTVDGTDYEHYSSEVELGYAGDNTAASPLAAALIPEGFELKSGEPVAVEINDNGTTVAPVRYDRKDITLTYNLNGGNVGGSTDALVRNGLYGAPIPSLGTIEQEGRTLSGWKEGSTTVTLPSTFPSVNKTYVAQWSADAYTITYLTNGGEIATSPAQPISYDIDSSEILLPGQTGAPTITRTGYTFAGWYAYSDFSGEVQTSIPTGSTGNKTFCANWTPIDYTITLYTNSSLSYPETTLSYTAGYTAPATYNIETGATLPTSAQVTARPGYTFAGWSENETDTSGSITSIPTGITGNKTYYLHWTANTDTSYTVTHWQQHVDDNEYSLAATDDLTGTTDTTVTPTANSYIGFTAITPIEPLRITGDGTAAGNIYYNRNTHSVSYADGVDGVNIAVPATQNSVRYGKPVTPNFTGIGTRAGYTFAGWKYGTTTWTDGGAQAPLTMPDANVTFTAQWTPIEYSLTLEENDSDFSEVIWGITEPTTYTIEDTPVTLPVADDLMRTGYTFNGWWTAATGGSRSYTIPTNATGNQTFYAHWTTIPYTITYVLNGGTNSASNPSTYTIESNIDLAAPTRGTYRFDGWYTDLEDPTTKVEGINPGDHENITLEAGWSALYAIVDGDNMYSKAETLAAINAKDGTYTITLTGEVTAADLGPSGTTGTILNAIRQKNEDEGVNYDASANITLNIPETAGIALTTGNEFFEYCHALVAADLCGLDTSAVTNMEQMFNYCANLASVDVSSWNTSSVTSMSNMFDSCETLASLDLSSFDTSSVTNMASMFNDTERLEVLNLVSFNTVSVTNMRNMFNDLGNHNSNPSTVYVSNAFVLPFGTDVVGMFNYAYIAGGAGTVHNKNDSTTIRDYARIDGAPSSPGYFTEYEYVAKVGKRYCEDIDATLDAIEHSSGEINIVLSKLATQSNIGNYSTSGTIIYAIKNNCGASTVNLSVASGVTITFSGHMANLFYGCTKLKSADLRGFDTSDINGMGSMFNGCTKLESVNLSSFDTHSVTSMSSMFQGCSKVTELDLSSFDLQSVTTMSNMFKSCSALKHITFSQNPNTAELVTLDGAFSYCSALTELDLSGFDTSNLISLNEMCRSCTALKYINLSGFECPNVGSFEGMFAYCSNLEILDLRELAPTGSVTNVGLMFVGCDNLRKIFVNTDFVTKVEGATNDVSMFNGCTSLVGGAGTTYDASNPNDKTYAIIDGGASNPGYFSGVTNYARVGDTYYSNKANTVSAILDSTGDIDVVLYRVSAADIGAPSTSGTIAKAILDSSATSIRLIVDRTSGLVVNNSNTIGFSGCEKLVYADLRGLDFSSKSNLTYLFYGCSNLKSVNLAGNTPSLNNVNYLFNNCTALEEVDISGWNFNVSAPTNLTCSSMFYGCTSLKVIYASYNFPSSVSSATDLFKNCTDLKGGAGTEFDASDTNYLSRACIDGGPDNPGYFTYRAP